VEYNVLAQVSNKDGVVVDAGFSTRERERERGKFVEVVVGARKKGGGQRDKHKAKMEQTLEKWPKWLSPKK
jgi:hypothetical protein